mgnify:CR=1 FL=1
MKFLILDIYKNDNWRLVKDTAGGYGTGNDFGNSFFSRLINTLVSKMINMPPMYSMYILSILKKRNSHATYSKNYNLNELNEIDYIITTSSIICHETEIEALKQLVSKNKKIFVTGVFANVMKKKYNFDKNIYVVPGEPEAFFLNVDLDKSSLDSFFQDEKSSKQLPEIVDNLDNLPFPDWSEYLKNYKLRNNFLGFNSKSAIPIVATRGCPYSCFNYCTYPLQQGRKVRLRSIKNIVTEIKYWIETIGTNKFIFRDPVFSINRKHTIELCKEIINQKLKIEYLIETHLKNLDDEMISLLKQSGLKMVYIGIESSNSNILKDIKRFTIANDDQQLIINKLVKEGIFVKSMFMFGNPEDTEESVKNTIDYSIKLSNQLVQYSVFTPYPGTPIFNHYENKITENNYEQFNQYNLTFKHRNLDNTKIKYLKNYGYKRFYFRIKNLPLIFRSCLSLIR